MHTVDMSCGNGIGTESIKAKAREITKIPKSVFLNTFKDVIVSFSSCESSLKGDRAFRVYQYGIQRK